MREPLYVGRVTGKFPRFLFCSELIFILFKKNKNGDFEVKNKTIENKKGSLKDVGEAQTFGFELIDPSIQFCLHRGKEWEECFLLIKLNHEVFEIKCSSTDSALKTLFCRLFSLANGNDIKITHKRVIELDKQLHDYLIKK